MSKRTSREVVAWHANFDAEFDRNRLREWRCTKCRGLLAMEYVHSGNLAIKCYHQDISTGQQCGELNRLMVKRPRDILEPATPKGGRR